MVLGVSPNNSQIMSQGFDPTGFKLLSRDVLVDYKELPHDVARVHLSRAPENHPFQQAREYKRALNAAKLERVFAKPFIGSLPSVPSF